MITIVPATYNIFKVSLNASLEYYFTKRYLLHDLNIKDKNIYVLSPNVPGKPIVAKNENFIRFLPNNFLQGALNYSLFRGIIDENLKDMGLSASEYKIKVVENYRNIKSNDNVIDYNKFIIAEYNPRHPKLTGLTRVSLRDVKISSSIKDEKRQIENVLTNVYSNKIINDTNFFEVAKNNTNFKIKLNDKKLCLSLITLSSGNHNENKRMPNQVDFEIYNKNNVKKYISKTFSSWRDNETKLIFIKTSNVREVNVKLKTNAAILRFYALGIYTKSC